MGTFIRVLTACLAALPSTLAQWTVVERNGRIALQDGQGNLQRLTETGRDSNPWISCDQKSVLFVRSSPGDPFTTAVYEIDLPSKQERPLFNDWISYQDGRTHFLAEPQMDSSHELLYVLARYDMSTGGVFAINLRSKSIKHLADCAGFILIESGTYAGDFLLEERNVSIVGEVYYVYQLYSAEGKDLGLAGPRDMELGSLGCNGTHLETQEQAPPTAATATPAPSQKPLPVPAKAMAARLKSQVEPAQSVPAYAAAVDRVVNLSVTISKEGKVVSAELVSGPPKLVQAAIAAVRQWKYEPYEVNGKTVEVTTEVTVQFAAKP